jgi:hypothetical protein
MNPLQDRRVQLTIAAGAALLLALLLAVFMLRQPKGADKTADQAKGALQVDTVQNEAKVSQTKPLRCFVGGQYVGDFPVLECAKRNGVAAQALDVGLDPATGQVAGGSAPLQPLPAPTPAAAPAPAVPVSPPALAETPRPSVGGDCLRYSGGEWRGVGQGMSVAQCVRVLFDGRCVRPGDALYGRSGSATVRLLPGRVELSPDNRNFHTLMTQDQDCQLEG